ncbi:hypothetical protein BLNAU_14400 [Blattamonas nauphoetae]|uniref:Uncharacterized protein n=1 Tax=Blattamonas nauphoetae TaxID=2049346 RepID=A0ABQ9XH48_9EUKA|nr:hypothetical protein BLNAU_14400 [Blattamonas nauphoetae]
MSQQGLSFSPQTPLTQIHQSLFTDHHFLTSNTSLSVIHRTASRYTSTVAFFLESVTFLFSSTARTRESSSKQSARRPLHLILNSVVSAGRSLTSLSLVVDGNILH